MPPPNAKYLEPFPQETTAIYEYREEHWVEASASGFGASSAPPSSGVGGGAPGPALEPAESPSGVNFPDNDEPWTEAWDEPILDGQGTQIGVRHNSRTTYPKTDQLDWSTVDVVFGRVVSETYGSKLPDDSGSYTDRSIWPDGTHLVTRTLEPGGQHGREVTTVIDANGQTTAESVTEW